MNIQNRKKVVIYGNCHMTSVGDVLSHVKGFTSAYELCEILPIFQIDGAGYFENPVFSECDIFIHQSIRKNNRYGEEFSSENVIKRLKNTCKVIAVPNLYHMPMCVFPQYMEKEELTRDSSGQTWFFRDQIVEDGFLKGEKLSQIKNDYLNINYYSRQEIQEKWNAFIDKVKAREQEWDIKISSFIKEEIHESQLFFDPNHPTKKVIEYIVTNILDLLDVEYTLEDLANAMEKVLDMNTREMPICASVSDYFGLEYDLKTVSMRSNGYRLLGKTLGLEEYIIQYESLLWRIDSVKGLLKIKSFLIYAGIMFIKAINRLKRCIVWE